MKQLPATLAATTAIAVTGALAMPAAAQAHPLVPMPLAPACAAYQFPAGTVKINYLAINGFTTFDLSKASPEVDTEGAVTHYPDGGDTTGRATGSIHGVGIHLEIGRGKYDPLILDGLINPDGKATGDLDFKGTKQNWASDTKFSCLDNPEPEKVGPAPKPVENNPAPPSGGTPGQGSNELAPEQVPVTDAIKMSFGQPSFTSITATVTNSSALKAACTYDATPSDTHRDFTVPPNGTTNLTFNGLSLGATYHAVVSCHDASGKQPQEIGHAETDVTF
jgi:hypothetical protein